MVIELLLAGSLVGAAAGMDGVIGPRSLENGEVIVRAAAKSPWISTTVIGSSAAGRPLTAVRMIDGSGPGEWRLLLIGSQHGNEPAGREALLELVRLVAGNRRLLPPGAELWAVPTANPDGIAVGARRNGAGADLNRDWLTLEQPETAAIHELARAVQPHVVIDLHEFNRTSGDWRDAGWDEWPLATLDTANHPLLPDDVYEVGLAWIEAAGRRMFAAGIPFRRYLVGGVPPRGELRPSTLDADDARNALALLGGLAFIVETGVRRAEPQPDADLARRVAAQLELLDLFIRDRELRRASIAAGNAIRMVGAPRWIPVNVMWGNAGPKVAEVAAVDRFDGATKRIETANLMHDRIVKRSVRRASAYAIPASSAAPFAALLDRHGLTYTRLEEPADVTVERCRMVRLEEGYDEVYERYSGRQVVECEPARSLHLDPGSLVIRPQLPDRARADALLEPQQLYGLYQFSSWRSLVARDGAIPTWRVVETAPPPSGEPVGDQP